MPDPLAVSPEGLHAASGTLREHATLLTSAAGTPSSAGTNASSLGAASVTAAIAEFSQAYSARIADRGQSAEVAAASYTIADDEGAADIGRVSV